MKQSLQFDNDLALQSEDGQSLNLDSTYFESNLGYDHLF